MSVLNPNAFAGFIQPTPDREVSGMLLEKHLPLCIRAHNGTSHLPEKRGRSYVHDYSNAVSREVSPKTNNAIEMTEKVAHIMGLEGSKSEKARQLAKLGYQKADIARLLEMTYSAVHTAVKEKTSKIEIIQEAEAEKMEEIEESDFEPQQEDIRVKMSNGSVVWSCCSDDCC